MKVKDESSQAYSEDNDQISKAQSKKNALVSSTKEADLCPPEMAGSNASMPSMSKNLPISTKKQQSEDLNDREQTSETPLPLLKSPTMPQEEPVESMRANKESFDSSSTELQGASKSTHSIKLETNRVKGGKSSDSEVVSQNPNIDASLAK